MGERERGLLAELRVVYDEADSLLQGWTCPASSECCQFGVTGKEPYITSIEALEIRRGQRAAGRKPSPPPRKIADDAVGACPMLTAGLRCSVYSSRPLGCRTFFCSRATPGDKVPHARWRELVRRVEDIGRRHEKGGEIGRPLRTVLG